MDLKVKIGICVAPYLLAVALWFVLTGPAFSIFQEKTTELDSKTRERDETKRQLKGLINIENQAKKVEADIEVLRASVPKDPQLDILIIDLERMCKESHIEVVSIEPPEQEKIKEAEENQLKELSQGKVGEMLAKYSGKKESDKKKGGKKGKKLGKKKGPAAKEEEEEGSEFDVGLKKEMLQVCLQGDYPGLVEVMRKIEAYQRIVDVNSVEIGGKDPEAKNVNNKKLLFSFFMTAYYLP